ncbi:hypothetical protein BCR33DRAFT_763878 [Rhizoclosmatium globosum]|uniref:FAD-binding domain-containing protein n=1 Tax=Rhizoclosmatium globosum TaxID=329046 RepID=A0A1Y2CM78_9FUNG|nr:hypothetical protein BCR33DRAFT_763878 [Rhizoclosmatium globosum]|eukprot:ORY48131.1 hypothetical protein BCR33DRAFT_763878 [Rhizoclosmatium globosum]
MTFALLDGSDRIPKKTQKEISRPFLSLDQSSMLLLCGLLFHGIKAFGGKKIKNLTQSDDEVTVEFEDGSQVVAELLRTLPDGTEIDFDCQRAIYGDPVNSRFIFGARCEKTTGAFFVADLNATKPLDGGDDWRPYTDLPKESSELADLVASWGAAQNVVNCIRYAKRINPANLYDLPNLSTFYKGRVVLVGDAAHGTIPFYGQGLNQAFEDAGVLGDLLGHFQDKDYGAAFAAYDQIRVPRAHLCAAEARKNAGRMKASNHVQMKIGRFVMRLVFTIMNAFGVDDEVYYHDFRDDVIKTIPGIQLK